MKLFRHLSTITRHRHAVIRHGFRAGIGWQALFHDLSKYTPTELIPGVRYYQGQRSPNERERELFGYSAAWLHHKGRNRHHFEYWTDYQPAVRRVMPVKMPYRYVVETPATGWRQARSIRGTPIPTAADWNISCGARKTALSIPRHPTRSSIC